MKLINSSKVKEKSVLSFKNWAYGKSPIFMEEFTLKEIVGFLRKGEQLEFPF